MKNSTLKSVILFLFISIDSPGISPNKNIEKKAIRFLREETIAKADKALVEKPITITDSICSRSAGGKHDFYSEADYSWPDPSNPGGPYINQ